MGKHKSTIQEEVFLSFMKDNPDLARGFANGNKVAADAKWADLCGALNEVGPPIKDVSGWKKANIRKKIAKNMVEATGGDPYSQSVITEGEMQVAMLCGLYEIVEGVGAASYGVSSGSTVVPKREAEDESENDQDSRALPSFFETEEVLKRKTDESENYQVSKAPPSLLETEEERMPKRRRTSADALDLHSLCAAQLDVMNTLITTMSDHFKKMETLQQEDLVLKIKLLSKFNEILTKLEL